MSQVEAGSPMLLPASTVFFHVSSPGYEYPKDFFDNRGVKLHPLPGGHAEVKLKRLQIAERLYRVTGAGIYRDDIRVKATAFVRPRNTPSQVDIPRLDEPHCRG